MSTTRPSEVSATVCSNCGTTTTPLWRRSPNGETICNACGLYLKARHTLRPTHMKRSTKKTDPPIPETCPGNGQCNGTGGSSSCAGCPAYNQVARHALICANCRATTTPLWRRDESGNTICNACGLYYKLHHVHRPVSMKRSVITRRKRIIVGDEDEREKSVPAIEDYIEPKRTMPPPLPSPPPSSMRMPAPPRTPPSFNRVLPSISDIKRFDPIFDYRSTNSNGYQDLAQFDQAMTRLERIRRRVPVDKQDTLSGLTPALQDIAIQAERILSKK